MAARDEQRVTGENACRAVFARRPDDVLRCFLLESRVGAFRSELRALAERRRPYRIVPREELDRLAGGVHHEGVCLFTRRRPDVDVRELERRARDAKGTARMLYLDGVENPHNLGAILRSAAHFGALALLGPSDATPELGAAAARVAEGGAEHVPVVRLDAPEATLGRLAALGFALVGADASAKRSLYEVDLPAKAVLLLGAERSGLSKGVRSLCTTLVRIPGTGAVESLNVSTAAAVLLAEHARRHPVRP
jgi:TrmH RNA methyltransferase